MGAQVASVIAMKCHTCLQMWIKWFKFYLGLGHSKNMVELSHAGTLGLNLLGNHNNSGACVDIFVENRQAYKIISAKTFC